jgi:hypothetical protein
MSYFDWTSESVIIRTQSAIAVELTSDGIEIRQEMPLHGEHEDLVLIQPIHLLVLIAKLVEIQESLESGDGASAPMKSKDPTAPERNGPPVLKVAK